MRFATITMPTPFPIGAVNVFLVLDEPLTLIDAGPKTPEALATLREGFRKVDRRFSDLRRLILTHTHEDHYGLARTLRDEVPELEILVHPWEMGHTEDSAADRDARAMLLRVAGVPQETIMQFAAAFDESRSRYADPLAVEEFSELRDDAEIEFATGTLRVVHTPGHTPGSCSLVREANRTIFAGDTILKRITPNPVLYPDPIDPTRRFRSLAEYLVSLARLRSFAPTLVYGAHGAPVDDYEELFNRYLRSIRDRQRDVMERLPKEGATAWQLAREMFPDASGIHAYLALSEASAHLDLAHAECKIDVEMRGEEEVFRRAI